MNDEKPHSRAGAPPAFDPDATCDECGAFGAYPVGDGHLCADCQSGKASCCPEFGKDDLWRTHHPEWEKK